MKSEPIFVTLLVVDLLEKLEAIPDAIAWGSLAFGAMIGGLAVAAAIKRWHGVILLMVGVPVLLVGLNMLMPAHILPAYTLAFYVGGLAILIGVAIHIN